MNSLGQVGWAFLIADQVSQFITRYSLHALRVEEDRVRPPSSTLKGVT